MSFEDIHLADKNLWELIKQQWVNKDYADAQSTMDVTNLPTQVLRASLLNELTNYIMHIEELNDNEFKVDKIQVFRQKPDNITKNQIYFQLTNDPYTFADVDALGMTFANVDTMSTEQGYTWADADRGGW